MAYLLEVGEVMPNGAEIVSWRELVNIKGCYL